MNIDNFKIWLNAHGAELLPVTNEYEVVRFTCKHGTGVLYKGKKGFSTNSCFVDIAIDCYKNSKKWDGKLDGIKRQNNNKTKDALIRRDGNLCFYCGTPMHENDRTEEHILSLVHGGNNRIENKVLTHLKCNELAGNKPIIEKIKLRDKLRYEN